MCEHCEHMRGCVGSAEALPTHLLSTCIAAQLGPPILPFSKFFCTTSSGSFHHVVAQQQRCNHKNHPSPTVRLKETVRLSAEQFIQCPQTPCTAQRRGPAQGAWMRWPGTRAPASICALNDQLSSAQSVAQHLTLWGRLCPKQ